MQSSHHGLSEANEHETVPAPTLTKVATFGAQFMTPYETPVEGLDPSGVKSNWTTNEDQNG